MLKAFWRFYITGMIVLVPAWATFMILSALFRTLDGFVGQYMINPIPGLGVLLLVLLLILAGLMADHVIGQVLVQDVTRIAGKINRLNAAIKVGPVLVGITAEEAVKILKSQPGRPQIKRTRSAGLVARHVVVLAKKRGIEAIAGENPPDGGGALRNDAVIARKTGGHVGDDAVAYHMVVAPG